MSIIRNSLHIGKGVLGSTAGAPLSADANNLLASGISNTLLTGSSTVTTTSGTYSTVSGMTTTPAAGTYLVIFSGTFRIASNGADGDIAIFKAGSIIQDSNRRQFTSVTIVLGLIGNNLQSGGDPVAIVTVNGSQVIDGRFRATAGTLAVDDRNMVLVRLA